MLAPSLVSANVYLTNAGAGLSNSITITPISGSSATIRTAASGQETSTAPTAKHPLNIYAGAGGILNLNTISSGSIAIGMNPSTFSASGGLSLAPEAALNLSGANGSFMSFGSSMTILDANPADSYVLQVATNSNSPILSVNPNGVVVFSTPYLARYSPNSNAFAVTNPPSAPNLNGSYNILGNSGQTYYQYLDPGDASFYNIVYDATGDFSFTIIDDASDNFYSVLYLSTSSFEYYGSGGITADPVFTIDAAGDVTAVSSVTANSLSVGASPVTWYYCTGSSGGAQDGNLCRGNGCLCTGGTWIATSISSQ